MKTEQKGNRPCAVCGGRSVRPYLSKAGLQLVQCLDCFFVFSNAGLEKFADASFYEREAGGFYISNDKLRGDYSPVRYTREIRLFNRYCAPGRVLDVGCSSGGFLFYLQQAFPDRYESAGTDVATEALDYAESRGIRVVRRNFLDDDFPFRDLDAITFWAVLEHVAEPRQFLEQARRVLHPAGIAFVLVPNFASLATKILGAKYRYILPQHLNYFTRSTLTRLARASGFSVMHSTTSHFNPVVIWQDLRSRGEEVNDTDRAQLLLKTNRMKQNAALAPVRLIYKAAELLLSQLRLADNLVLVLRKDSVRH